MTRAMSKLRQSRCRRIVQRRTTWALNVHSICIAHAPEIRPVPRYVSSLYVRPPQTRYGSGSLTGFDPLAQAAKVFRLAGGAGV